MNLHEFNQKIGFLRPGWWIVHVIGITALYTIGAVLGRYL
ncbi:MAG: hypothetical protein FD164_1698 [Nitrospirae bacterium]|nr:MAG: hypothetical protein FD164_1698 [Nitrospirota bacterium]